MHIETQVNEVTLSGDLILCASLEDLEVSKCEFKDFPVFSSSRKQ